MPKNVQLIQMPHRCGHGIVPLPETIKPYINTTLAWDNIDRLEETLSGTGTKKDLARLNLAFLSVMRFHGYCVRGSSEVPQIKNTLKLKSIVVVFALTLYAKASGGQWKQNAKFKDMVMKMEVFHRACTMLSITGKRFQDTGLWDLCVESGVIAEGSIAEVLQGRRYNSGVGLHKLVYEALMRLAWRRFKPWIEESYKSIVDGLFGEIGDLYDDICKR